MENMGERLSDLLRRAGKLNPDQVLDWVEPVVGTAGGSTQAGSVSANVPGLRQSAGAGGGQICIE